MKFAFSKKSADLEDFDAEYKPIAPPVQKAQAETEEAVVSRDVNVRMVESEPQEYTSEKIELAAGVHSVTSSTSAKRRKMREKRGGNKADRVSSGAQNAVIAEDKKISAIGKISLIWTVISTVYAIVSTCLFIWRGWVSHTVSYVLVGVLALYVCIFIALVVMVIRNPKSGKKNVKLYKKLLKIFKIIANIAFLVLTAISLAGMTQVGMDGVVLKWILFVASFAVAVIQLGLKVTLLAMKFARMLIAKKFRVEVERFVDGRRQKKNLRAKLEERKYREE